MTTRKARLTFKFGDKEVQYEAERDAVEAQLEHLVNRLLDHAPEDVGVGMAEVPAAAPTPTTEPAPVQTPAVSPEEIEARQLAHLYRITDEGRLRLRQRPERTADTLLLVLYGMLKLQDRRAVPAPGMTAAARASGARFERADRLLAGFQDLVEGFGKRRAKRYRLTAAGRKHCARLVTELVGPLPEPPPAPKDARTAEKVTADGIPIQVASRWDGELLPLDEAARRLQVEESEVQRLRRDSVLFGLPYTHGGRRHYFYPAFQIDAARHEVYREARKITENLRFHRSKFKIGWWGTVEPQLGRRPMEMVGTGQAEDLLRFARKRFKFAR